MIGGTMESERVKAIRESGYRLNKAMIEARHNFERLAEAWTRSQNEERRQKELNKLRNRSLR
jgi:hypothetical protein